MSGIDLIAAERARQVNEEGWSPEHDETHDLQELARAAAAYAMPEALRLMPVWDKELWRLVWPGFRWRWKPSPDDRVRELVKAGALIAAEIDRLEREAEEGERDE